MFSDRSRHSRRSRGCYRSCRSHDFGLDRPCGLGERGQLDDMNFGGRRGLRSNHRDDVGWSRLGTGRLQHGPACQRRGESVDDIMARMGELNLSDGMRSRLGNQPLDGGSGGLGSLGGRGPLFGDSLPGGSRGSPLYPRVGLNMESPGYSDHLFGPGAGAFGGGLGLPQRPPLESLRYGNELNFGRMDHPRMPLARPYTNYGHLHAEEYMGELDQLELLALHDELNRRNGMSTPYAYDGYHFGGEFGNIGMSL